MKPLRVGLIGTGDILSGYHMPGWTALRDAGRVELAAACDVRRERADRLAKEHDIPLVFDDYGKMLREARLDMVDIATPNAFHAPAALAALAAGCHVYCEKPLAPTPQEVTKLIAARDKAGRKLMTGQQMRFEGKNVALKRFAEAGVLGDVYYARASWFRQRQAPAWGGFLKKGLAGGGPLIDIGVHLLDLVLWMMGFPEPVAVCGVAPTKLANLKHVVNSPMWGDWKRDGKDFDVEDFAVGLVRFEDGAVLVLEASFLMNIIERELRKVIVCGTLGGMDIGEGKIMTQEHGVVRVSQVTGFAEPKALPAAIAAFVDAVEKDGPVPVPAEETLCVMTILDGIYRSHAKGGAEVKLACAALEQEESGVQP